MSPGKKNRTQSLILMNVYSNLDPNNENFFLASNYSDTCPSSPVEEENFPLLANNILLNSNDSMKEDSHPGRRKSAKFSKKKNISSETSSRSSSSNSKGSGRSREKKRKRSLSPKILPTSQKQDKAHFSNDLSSILQGEDTLLPSVNAEIPLFLDSAVKPVSERVSSASRRRFSTLPPRKTGVPGSPFMAKQRGNSVFVHAVPALTSSLPILDQRQQPSEKVQNSASAPLSIVSLSNNSSKLKRGTSSTKVISSNPSSVQARPVSFSGDYTHCWNPAKRGLPDSENKLIQKSNHKPEALHAERVASASKSDTTLVSPISQIQGAVQAPSKSEANVSHNLPRFLNPFSTSSTSKESPGSSPPFLSAPLNSVGNNREKISLTTTSIERPVAMSPRSLTRRASILVDGTPEISSSSDGSEDFSVDIKELSPWKYKINIIEWIQVPVLFDLFTYLIQFHELQELPRRNDREKCMVEEALSCLTLRISFSTFQVDGILLNSLFTKWDNKEHRALVQNIVTSWKKGINCQEFKDASVKVLHAISINDVSNVRFSAAYKVWRWCGSFQNCRLFFGVVGVVGVIIFALNLVLFFGPTFSAAVRAVLLSLILLLTFCLTIWSLIITSHNSYADAASTFFRENARSSAQIDSFFSAAEEEEEIESLLSKEVKTSPILNATGRRRNSSSFLSNTHVGIGGAPNANNQTISQYSFLSVLSNSANRADNMGEHKSPDNGVELSGVLQQLPLTYAPPLPSLIQEKVGYKSNLSGNNRAGTGTLNNEPEYSPLAMGSPYKSSTTNPNARSRPVVKVDSMNTEGSISTAVKQCKSTEGSPVHHEEKRLKRSESKKYLFSRSLTGPGGLSSIQSSLAVALVLIPTHLCTASNDNDNNQMSMTTSRTTPIREEFPLITQSDFNSFISALECRGLKVLKFTNIGSLDEAFHQGVNKNNIILLPSELWMINTSMREVVVRWLTVEFRCVFFFSTSLKSQDFKSNDFSSYPSFCASPVLGQNGDIGSLSGALNQRSRGGFSEINDLNISVDDPSPPSNLSVSVPLSDTATNRLYDSAMERAQSKKAIFHSYVPSYSLGQRLGGGAFASVFSAVLDETGTRCAVKRIQLGGDCEERESANLLRAAVEEVELLSTVYHPNIVRYMYTERSGNTLSIFMERCSGGTLQSLLTNVNNNIGPPLTAVRVKRMLTEIISAVAFLHVKLIIHRDLKPDNILFHEDGTVRLVDFGSAGLRKDNFAKIEGTLAYMAPEVLLEMPYGKECDIWSVGCVAAGIFGIELPQTNMGFVELHDFFSEMKSEPDFICEEEGVRRFLLNCLKKNPAARMQCIDLLQDEVLTPNSTAIEKCLEKALERRRSSVKKKSSTYILGSLPSDSNMSLWSTHI